MQTIVSHIARNNQHQQSQRSLTQTKMTSEFLMTYSDMVAIKIFTDSAGRSSSTTIVILTAVPSLTGEMSQVYDGQHISQHACSDDNAVTERERKEMRETVSSSHANSYLWNIASRLTHQTVLDMFAVTLSAHQSLFPSPPPSQPQPSPPMSPAKPMVVIGNIQRQVQQPNCSQTIPAYKTPIPVIKSVSYHHLNPCPSTWAISPAIGRSDLQGGRYKSSFKLVKIYTFIIS